MKAIHRYLLTIVGLFYDVQLYTKNPPAKTITNQTKNKAPKRPNI